MPSIAVGSCDGDCSCLLCRELKGCRMPVQGSGSPPGRRDAVNFILRRGLPFRARTPSKEWLETEDPRFAGYEDSATLEDKSPGPETGPAVAGNGPRRTDKDVAHKTVIYFGDSSQRQRENNKRAAAQTENVQQQQQSVLVVKEDKRMIERDGEEDPDGRTEDEKRFARNRIERQRSTVSLVENEDAKVTHEIVVNVSPSREDVLRIEEDESQVEDYWSLPGDNTGFKADWSFVQQWRLRG